MSRSDLVLLSIRLLGVPSSCGEQGEATPHDFPNQDMSGLHKRSTPEPGMQLQGNSHAKPTMFSVL